MTKEKMIDEMIEAMKNESNKMTLKEVREIYKEYKKNREELNDYIDRKVTK